MANTQGETRLMIIIIAALIFCFIGFYATVIIPFKKERRYLKMELKRSAEEDKEYWKREIRRLYISYIFFMGKD